MHNLIARLIGAESGRDQSSGKRWLERIPLIFENHGPSRRIQNSRRSAFCLDKSKKLRNNVSRHDLLDFYIPTRNLFEKYDSRILDSPDIT